MTNQTPESVIAEVIEYHADTIGSHWDGCYKHHAVCLAVKLRDMLREPGVPDAALIREAKAEALTEAVAMVSDEEHAFVDKMWGTVVPKLTIIGALRARAAEYREGSET